MSQKCDFCKEVKDDKDMEKELYQGKPICKECKEKEVEITRKRREAAINELIGKISGNGDHGDDGSGTAGGMSLEPSDDEDQFGG